MKINKNYKIIYLNAIISIIAIFTTAILTNHLSKRNELETRKHELNKEALSNVLTDVLFFSNYWTINWDSVSNMPYDKYSGYSLTYEDMGVILDSLFKMYPEAEGPNPLLFEQWELLQKAKQLFYKLSLNARIIGTDEIRTAIIDVENGFDEVFEKMIINGGYYLRAPMENYNEVMPAKFHKLELVFREEILK